LSNSFQSICVFGLPALAIVITYKIIINRLDTT
jgi:hypothetical protein